MKHDVNSLKNKNGCRGAPPLPTTVAGLHSLVVLRPAIQPTSSHNLRRLQRISPSIDDGGGNGCRGAPPLPTTVAGLHSSVVLRPATQPTSCHNLGRLHRISPPLIMVGGVRSVRQCSARINLPHPPLQCPCTLPTRRAGSEPSRQLLVVPRVRQQVGCEVSVKAAAGGDNDQGDGRWATTSSAPRDPPDP